MSDAPITATVDISSAMAPRLKEARDKLTNRTGLHLAMAMGVEAKVMNRFRLLSGIPNKLGGVPTRFWQRASGATAVDSDGQAGYIRIPQAGIRLQYLGGTVVPKNRKWLTIPAAPEAHGKRVEEVAGGYANQKWLFGKGRKPYAIADKATGKIYFWLTKKATIKPFNPSVLPAESTMQRAAAEAASTYLTEEVAS